MQDRLAKRQHLGSKSTEQPHPAGGSSENLLTFFDRVTKLVTAPVHINLTDGYLVG
jgi:hypothetical protein